MIDLEKSIALLNSEADRIALVNLKNFKVVNIID